jgi:excinuclease ABC subunit A
MARLSESDREVLLLRHFEGLSNAEVGALLGLTPSAVSKRYGRAVLRLHDFLLDVIKTADHVIDLGPEGGHAGGEVVVTGTPEEIASCKRSHTSRRFAGLHIPKAHAGSAGLSHSFR